MTDETKGADSVKDSEDASKADTTDDKGKSESTEPSTTDDEKKSSKGDKKAQAAIQRAREAEKAALKKAREAEEQVRQLKLSKLSEADRAKEEARLAKEESAKIKLETAVTKELSDKGITGPLAELVLSAPWSIPPVAKELAGKDDPTWEEVIEAVNRYMPSYLDSLVKQLKGAKSKPKGEDKDTAPDSEDTQVDTERSAPVVKRKIFSRAEIQKMKPETFKKNKAKILQSMADQGGVLPE